MLFQKSYHSVWGYEIRIDVTVHLLQVRKLRLGEAPDDLPEVSGRAGIQRNTDPLPRPLHSRLSAPTKQLPQPSPISAPSSLRVPPVQCCEHETASSRCFWFWFSWSLHGYSLVNQQQVSWLLFLSTPADENNGFALKREYCSITVITVMAM